MAEFGAALAIIAFADQCIKYGQKLVRRCQNYRHAEEEARSLLISIEVNWVKTEAQISFLKRVSHSLDARYCDVQSLVLSELEGKLKTASLTMDQLITQDKEKDVEFSAMVKALGKMAPMRKAKYAFKKEALEKIIIDLESWQRRFDPSWMLIMRMADEKIDQQLDREEKRPKQSGFIMAAKGVRDAAREPDGAQSHDGSIFVSAKELGSNETPIPFSSALLCRLSGSKNDVLVDTMVCDQIADIDRTTKDVRKLARILSKVDPATFGLLACRGVIKSSVTDSTDELISDYFKETPLHTFKFLFTIPPTLNSPQSLRTILIEGDPTCPLNSRFDLAKQLTNSVLFMHSSQFVHKNIRPETIIVFGNETSKIGSSYLVGFEYFRPVEGNTYRTSDGIWQHDLYRHPSRQGTKPEADYQMQHDIYSLGVCLLELGLWDSFITMPQSSPPSPTPSTTESSSLRPSSPTTLVAPTIPPFMSDLTTEKDTRKRANHIKTRLVDMATRDLPSRMGRKYTDIVLLCLQCMDGGAFGNEEEFLDEDGIVVGVRYMEKVLLKMQEISI